jgi:hypothetical protein
MHEGDCTSCKPLALTAAARTTCSCRTGYRHTFHPAKDKGHLAASDEVKLPRRLGLWWSTHLPAAAGGTALAGEAGISRFRMLQKLAGKGQAVCCMCDVPLHGQ